MRTRALLRSSACRSPTIKVLLLSTLLAQGCGESQPVGPSIAAGEATEAPTHPNSPPPRAEGNVVIDPVSRVTRLGGTQALTVRLRKQMVDASQLDWASLDPDIATVDETGVVTGVAKGAARVVGALGALRDTVLVSVDPVVATIERMRDTLILPLDQTQPLPFTARDSGGALLPASSLVVTTAGNAAVEMVGDGSVLGLLPGRGVLQVSAGDLADSVVLSVRGVVIIADGQRVTTPGSLLGAREIVIRNGRVRISWNPEVHTRVGFDMAVAVGEAWVPATVHGAADWLYIASGVITEPTSIDLITVSDTIVGLRMRAGNHRFRPAEIGYPAWYLEEPHPFSRTVWLRRGDWGYFSWIDLEEPLTYPGIEHEIGFGGMFGPAQISTSEVSFRTESLVSNFRFNEDWSPDAAEFLLDGDPLRRVLVPLPGAPMISPVFAGYGYGSTYVHRNNDQSYGAFMFAAPRSEPLPAREICQRAWRQAPFALPPVSDAELTGCGPA